MNLQSTRRLTNFDFLISSITIFGAYSRQIVAVLGDSEKQAWIPNTMNLVTVVLAPILSYMSDIFGDRISRVSQKTKGKRKKKK